MKRTLIYAGVFTLTTTALIFAGYASATADDTGSPSINNYLQYFPTRWQLVKQVFQIHIPKHGKALSQLIIDTPSTVAVSNDIDVFNDKGQKVNINISVDERRISIAFPETVTSSTSKLLVSLNKVRQPIDRAVTVYSLSAKVIGSDAYIPIGQAKFPAF